MLGPQRLLTLAVMLSALSFSLSHKDGSLPPAAAASSSPHVQFSAGATDKAHYWRRLC